MAHTTSLELAATCSRGFEHVLADEIRRLAASNVTEGRGVVTFRGGLETIYRVNLWSRTAIRVLIRLAARHVTCRDDIYAMARQVEWQRWLSVRDTFAVETAGRTPVLTHSGFAALLVKDAIVDDFRERTGRRPSVDRSRPSVRIRLHLSARESSILIDTSGQPLSRRGYRRYGGAAPLSESLAAGMLLLAGYDGTRPFLDPMCGSGTIAAEAALIASNTAPGLYRRFAVERLPCHDARMLAGIRAAAERSRRDPTVQISASDCDATILTAARRNFERARLNRWISLTHRDFEDLELPGENTLIVFNPPYGHRLDGRGELTSLYRKIGDTLKQRAQGATAWILVGSGELARSIGLHASARIILFNGPLECRFLRFDLYAGSRSGRPSTAATS